MGARLGGDRRMNAEPLVTILAPFDGWCTGIEEVPDPVFSGRMPGGGDVVVHSGIDTVELGGRGFEAQVKWGQVVEAGQELIRFDLDTVARGAKTLLTPVVVAASGALTIRHRRAAGIIKAGDVLFEIVQARGVVHSSEVTQTSDVPHSSEVTRAPASAQRTVTDRYT